jgi:hypothetical protein
MKTVPAIVLASMLIAGCGGGGSPPGPVGSTAAASIAGTYESENLPPSYAESTGARILLHPDGTLWGGAVRLHQDAPQPTSGGQDDIWFTGVLAPSGDVWASGQAAFEDVGYRFTVDSTGAHFTPRTTQRSPGSILVSQVTPGESIQLRLHADSIDLALPAMTLRKDPLRIAFQGLPQRKLEGVYSGGYYPRGSTGTPLTHVTLDAAGTLSGSIDDACRLTGRLFAYDPSSGMFRLQLSFQGAGCEVTGTGEFVGSLGGGEAVALNVQGLVNGVLVQVGLVHSQKLGTY